MMDANNLVRLLKELEEDGLTPLGAAERDVLQHPLTEALGKDN